jgi:hypothetical protein
MIDIKKLNIKEKVELFKQLYKDISSKGIKGDTELAHINEFEKNYLLCMVALELLIQKQV